MIEADTNTKTYTAWVSINAKEPIHIVTFDAKAENEQRCDQYAKKMNESKDSNSLFLCKKGKK